MGEVLLALVRHDREHPIARHPALGGRAIGDQGIGHEAWHGYLIFCASYDELSPGARELAPQDYSVGEGHCVDIVVEGTVADGLTRVDYEFRPIDGVLDQLGLPAEAVRCRSLSSGDLDSGVAAVRAVLAALLVRTAE